MFTIVSTPLVWLGLAACLVSSSAWWAACYGLMFGFGRWLQLSAHYIMGTDNPERVVLRTMNTQAGLTRILGIGGGTALLALAWLSR